MLLTEKDSQIALIEMSGAKTQSQIERLNRLHSDRCQIIKRLKIEVSSECPYFVSSICLTRSS